MSEREEVLLEDAFVLHHRPFRDSSLIVDCLTVRHGRVGLVSQGARRARTGTRALLQPFTPLRLSWVRRGELGRMTHAEAAGHLPPLLGNGLLAGFYLNELLIRLIERGDTNPGIFDCYRDSLERLATDPRVARTVRLFELRLLDTLGYRVELERDVRTGHALVAEQMYLFELESGPTAVGPEKEHLGYPGAHLISLRDGVLEDRASLLTAKRLLGRVLHSYLGDRPLKSRDVLKDLVGRSFGVAG